jgi:hypothetical protein
VHTMQLQQAAGVSGLAGQLWQVSWVRRSSLSHSGADVQGAPGQSQSAAVTAVLGPLFVRQQDDTRCNLHRASAQESGVGTSASSVLVNIHCADNSRS